MNEADLIIKIDWVYFIGIVGTLLTIAWIASAKFARLEEAIRWIKEKITSVEEDISSVEKDISALEQAVKAHGEDILQLKMHTKYGLSESPTVPSEEGKRLLRESGFYELYPELQPLVFQQMDQLNTRTLYDCERSAFRALSEFRNDPIMDTLKKYAVNHSGEDLDVIFKIASWIVRDDYAKEKGIKE